jgi:hypothetical protein
MRLLVALGEITPNVEAIVKDDVEAIVKDDVESSSSSSILYPKTNLADLPS